MYLPLHENESKRIYFTRIQIKKICILAVSLPLFAIFICIWLTMYKDYDNANYTHCNVPNVFPSISSAIGNYSPQSLIWQTAIYIHAPLRFLIIRLRWKYYISVILKDFDVIVNITVMLNFIENVALISLTFWNSKYYYPYHEISFKIFIGTSIFYMLFVCILLTKFRRRPNLTDNEQKSIRLKWRMFIANVVSFAFAAYFFLRHAQLCEPYVYSMFSFSEYIVVVTNIMYHMTTVYDLPPQYIYITSRGIRIE